MPSLTLGRPWRRELLPSVTLFAVSAFNSLPVAILSRSDAIIAGTLDVSAFTNLGGPGANLDGLGLDGSKGSCPSGEGRS